MDDKEIIDLYWQRDEYAITVTAMKYGKYCSSIAKNMLQDHEDAEECVNDTWLRAWDAIPPHRPARLLAFLGKITRELSLDRCRAQFTQKRGNGELALALDELDECIVGGKSAEEIIEYAMIGQTIGSFLNNQKEEYTDIFVRRYYYICSVKQIAEEFQMNENKVKSILFRVRKKLKKHLEGEGILL